MGLGRRRKAIKSQKSTGHKDILKCRQTGIRRIQPDENGKIRARAAAQSLYPTFN